LLPKHTIATKLAMLILNGLTTSPKSELLIATL